MPAVSLRTLAALRGLAPSWPPVSALHRMPWASPLISAERSSSTAAIDSSRDGAEVSVMRAWVVFALGMIAYTASLELVSPRTGSFLDVNTRGDVDRQMQAADAAAVREGRLRDAQAAIPTHPQHTLWWHLAQVKADPHVHHGVHNASGISAALLSGRTA